MAFTRTATVVGAFRDHFSSHSLLLTLAYNFGAVAEALGRKWLAIERDPEYARASQARFLTDDAARPAA